MVPLPVAPTASPLAAVVDDGLEALVLRRAEETSELAVGGPATEGADPADVPDPVAAPPEEADDCGAVVCGAGLAPSPFTFDGWSTEVGAGGVGVVLFVSVFTAAVVTGDVEAVVLATDWSTASEGFEPPLPLGATVVVGAGATVVLVAGAAVVGGVAATVLAVVPWVAVWAPAGGEAGAVWAEAGRAFSTRKRPARSAKDATHLRGLTTSILGLVLIGLNRPP